MRMVEKNTLINVQISDITATQKPGCESLTQVFLVSPHEEHGLLHLLTFRPLCVAPRYRQ